MVATLAIGVFISVPEFFPANFFAASLSFFAVAE
jgi:hypothetical protein